MNLLYGLTILFIGLKIIDQVDWSWWLTLTPLYFVITRFIFKAIFTDAVKRGDLWAKKLLRWINS